MLYTKIIWAIILFILILIGVALMPTSTTIFWGFVLHAGLVVYIAYVILKDPPEDKKGDNYYIDEADKEG